MCVICIYMLKCGPAHALPTNMQLKKSGKDMLLKLKVTASKCNYGSMMHTYLRMNRTARGKKRLNEVVLVIKNLKNQKRYEIHRIFGQVSTHSLI